MGEYDEAGEFGGAHFGGVEGGGGGGKVSELRMDGLCEVVQQMELCDNVFPFLALYWILGLFFSHTIRME